jgi:chromate reductase, NAD(P)H dehydrogenase (quinone)
MPGVNVSVAVGSSRRDSINGRLARAPIRLAEGKLAASFVQIDDLSMYSQDLESPLPASVARFKAWVEEVAALLFVSPEHNRSVLAVLKNAIDWGTRSYGRNSWAGKGVAIIGGAAWGPSARAGPIGTAMAPQHLRNVLGDLGALVMGSVAYVAFKPDLIEEADTVTDAGTLRFLQSFVDQIAGFAARLTSTPHAAAA